MLRVSIIFSVEPSERPTGESGSDQRNDQNRQPHSGQTASHLRGKHQQIRTFQNLNI